jgi:hypothetical protein
VAADLGEEDPDGELERIVQEAEQLAALVQTEAAGEEKQHPEGTRDAEEQPAGAPGGSSGDESRPDGGKPSADRAPESDDE